MRVISRTRVETRIHRIVAPALYRITNHTPKPTHASRATMNTISAMCCCCFPTCPTNRIATGYDGVADLMANPAYG
jgi:hypothetical protein